MKRIFSQADTRGEKSKTLGSICPGAGLTDRRPDLSPALKSFKSTKTERQKK